MKVPTTRHVLHSLYIKVYFYCKSVYCLLENRLAKAIKWFMRDTADKKGKIYKHIFVK